mmetsp:Transcript_115795/g.327541  ORF Transcript_115795/g.327541 Transcript_115795/m.327541 type:complete len:257 (-) Transcript_115795:2196-2966(-)
MKPRRAPVVQEKNHAHFRSYPLRSRSSASPPTSSTSSAHRRPASCSSCGRRTSSGAPHVWPCEPASPGLSWPCAAWGSASTCYVRGPSSPSGSAPASSARSWPCRRAPPRRSSRASSACASACSSNTSPRPAHGRAPQASCCGRSSRPSRRRLRRRTRLRHCRRRRNRRCGSPFQPPASGGRAKHRPAQARRAFGSAVSKTSPTFDIGWSSPLRPSRACRFRLSSDLPSRRGRRRRPSQAGTSSSWRPSGSRSWRS